MRKQHKSKSKSQRARQRLARHTALATRHMIRDRLLDAATTEEEKQHIRAMFDRGDRFIMRLHQQGYI